MKANDLKMVEITAMTNEEKARQQWIDKACDTIKYLLGGYVIRNFHFGDSYDMDKIVNDFKKAMKGE